MKKEQNINLNRREKLRCSRQHGSLSPRKNFQFSLKRLFGPNITMIIKCLNQYLLHLLGFHAELNAMFKKQNPQ
jgi:hypothetical protein